MKTIIDRLPIRIEEGKSVTVQLPEAFRVSDGLLMLVHNSLGETVQVTLRSEQGEELSQSFKLVAFPDVLVFPQEASGAKPQSYNSVTIRSFQALEGSLTVRTKNPPHILRAYGQ